MFACSTFSQTSTTNLFLKQENKSFLKQKRDKLHEYFSGGFEATKEGFDLGSSRNKNTPIFQEPMQGFRGLNEKMGLESVSFQDEDKCSVLLTAACNSDNRRESPKKLRVKSESRRLLQRRQF